VDRVVKPTPATPQSNADRFDPAVWDAILLLVARKR